MNYIFTIYVVHKLWQKINYFIKSIKNKGKECQDISKENYICGVTMYLHNTMIKKIIIFYIEGFMQMRLGKVLWAIIGIKLFVMFAILKVFFFPNTIANESKILGVDKSEYVANEITERITETENDTTGLYNENKQPKFNIYD